MTVIKARQNDSFSFSSNKFKKRKKILYFQPDTILFIAVCGIQVEEGQSHSKKLIMVGRIHFI